MPSAAFAKENHDSMKTSEIGIRMLVDDAVPAEQVFYLRRKWLLLGFQVLSPSLPVEVGWWGNKLAAHIVPCSEDRELNPKVLLKGY